MPIKKLGQINYLSNFTCIVVIQSTPQGITSSTDMVITNALTLETVFKTLSTYLGPVWINNLFAAYSADTYHNKCLCVNYLYSKRKNKVTLFVFI